MNTHLDSVQHINALNPYMWQLEALKLNTGDSDWGIGKEDMAFGTGMSQCLEYATWEDFLAKFRAPNEYNMVVNFRFEVERPHVNCYHCDGTGDHPALRLETDLNEFTGAKLAMDQDTLKWFVDRGWIASASHGRVTWKEEEKKFMSRRPGNLVHWIDPTDLKYPSLELINSQVGERKLNDDIFSILMKWNWKSIIRVQRILKGLPVKCDHCQGTGKIFKGEPRLALSLWYIHPGHGASKAVKISNIKQTDIDPILTFMQSAWKVLMDKFNPILHIHETNLANIKSVPGRWQDHRQQTSAEGSMDS